MRYRAQTAATAFAAAGLVLVLAGCSGTGGHAAPTTAAQATTPSTTVAATAIPDQAPTAIPPAPAPAPSQMVELPDSETRWMYVHPGLLPGVQFINLDSDISCSTGWITSNYEGRSFVLTAGHCGVPGDLVWQMDEYGDFTEVGEFVESRHDGPGGVDHGLIEIFDTAAFDSTPPTSIPIVGYADADWLLEYRPQICRIGFVTPQTCGEFIGTDGVTVWWRSASWDGDSGGPVFAVVDGAGYAVAVQSYRVAEDPNQTGGSLVAPAIEQWGLALHN